jgi:hypothetical protein
MKIACLFAAIGVASAVAPPKISLSLNGEDYTSAAARADVQLADSQQRADGHESIYRDHDLKATNVDHAHHKTAFVGKQGHTKRMAVGSRQDWTEKCAAGVDDYNSCHFPAAKAWDFVDKQAVEVRTRVFLVDRSRYPLSNGGILLKPEELDIKGCGNARFTAPEGCPINLGMKNKPSSMKDVARATYLFKYDATDVAGNHAEQVVFALIVDDPNPPIIEPLNKLVTDRIFHKGIHNLEDYQNEDAKHPGWSHSKKAYADYISMPCWKFTDETCNVNKETCTMKVEASRHPTWGLLRCTGRDGLRAWDAVDGDVSSTIRYSVINAKGKPIKHNGKTMSHAMAEAVTEYFADWTTVGSFKLQIHANDHAGVYGSDSMNNLRTVNIDVEVDDTYPPSVFVHGVDQPTIECNRDIPYKACSKREQQNEFDRPDNTANYRCDRGAAAWDELDGDLGTISRKNTTPNPSVWAKRHFGTDIVKGPTKFTITYSATDSTNSKTGTGIRIVTVEDTTAPKVVLVGDSDMEAHQNFKQRFSESVTSTQCRKVYNKAKSAYHSVCAHSAGDSFYDPGIEVADECDDLLNDRTDFSGRKGIFKGVVCPVNDVNLATKTSTDCWGGRVFDDKKVGKFVRTYSVLDASKNAKEVRRTFHVVDMTEPTIKLEGSDVETFEASRDVEYTDQGAKCQDYVDGDISHNVEVSGEIVNMKVPGTYHLQYDCQDNNGNMAVQKYRKIIIEDNSCPYLTRTGPEKVYVEAGFPYEDQGATATDTLDGDITARVRSVGNTVTNAQAFYYAKSCQEIKEIAQKKNYNKRDSKTGSVGAKHNLHDGQYYITTETNINGEKKTEAVVVTCNFQTGTTFFPLNANRAARDTHGASVVIDEHSHDQITLQEEKYANVYPTCEEYGFERFASVKSDDKQFAKTQFPSYDLMIKKSMHSDLLLCTKKASKFNVNAQPSGTQGFQLRAETGTYVITYYVHDLANNGQCPGELATAKRTVVVEDTLPPVISLKYKNQMIRGSVKAPVADAIVPRTGFADYKDGNGEDFRNPAELKVGAYKAANGNDYVTPVHKRATFAHYGNPQFGLMAQVATTNGWLIAAVASGIAGVALFSFSASKSTATVPV